MGTIAETLIAEGKIAGIAEGKLEGIAEGEARGEAQGGARTLVRQMERRFGVLMPEVHNRIQSASVEQLDIWLDRILDAQSIDAVFEDIYATRSAIQILINDWRVTPNNCASLSNFSTTQTGKSTFTLLVITFGLTAFE